MSMDVLRYLASGVLVLVAISFACLFARLYFERPEPTHVDFREPEWAEYLDRSAIEHSQASRNIYLVITAISLLVALIMLPG